MRVLVIGTSIFTLPPTGYSGLEWLVSRWSQLFRDAGHQVAVICPEGSDLGEGIEIIPTALGESEESVFQRHRELIEERLNDGWVCLDSSWQWFTVILQQESVKQLPIIHIYHTTYQNLHPGNRPPIQYPCLVGISKSHAAGISRNWQACVRTVYNGTDIDFYSHDTSVVRSDRWLWCARYTPEKGAKDAIFLARKTGISLDLYGDTHIIGPHEQYLNDVMANCDSRQVVFHPGAPRHETVNLYRNHRALIHWVNWEEPFGLVPVEAMACGMPVIVNRMGSLPELVKHGRTGFVVDTLEEAEDIIKKDLVSTIKAEDCIRNAKRFSIQKSAEGYLRLLEDVANGIYW